MIEFRLLGKSMHPLLSERHCGSELILSLEDLFTHPFELRPGEVPLGSDTWLGKVRFDRVEHADGKPILLHSQPVDFRHGELWRGYEIDLHRIEYSQSIRL